jgi:hypothetical protein
MRKCKIDIAVDQLNAKRGLKYPMIGHLRYANIVGDGRRYRTLYVIINDNGGVSYSYFNARNPRAVLAKLRGALDAS